MSNRVDDLSALSRDFYERSLAKLTYSLMFAAFGMMLLGFCASSGGLSAGGGELLKSEQYSNANSDSLDSLKAVVSGYGFASFAYFVGSVFMISMAIYITPQRYSNNEKKILENPDESSTTPPNFDGSTNRPKSTFAHVNPTKLPEARANAASPVIAVVAPSQEYARTSDASGIDYGYDEDV